MTEHEYLSWSLSALLSLLKQNAGRVKEMMNTQAVIAEEVEKRLDEEKADAGRISLPAFYLSQWDKPGQLGGYDVDADDRRGDCGPACLASMIFFLTSHRPTVDEVAEACGQPTAGSGANYTNHAQLRQGAAEYGITLRSSQRLGLMKETLVKQLRKGFPSIVLVNYKTMRVRCAGYLSIVQNQDTGFDGAHWVLVVGWNPESACLDSGFVINDPDFWGARRGEGNHRIVPEDVFLEAMGTVSATPGASRNYQGLVVAGLI